MASKITGNWTVCWAVYSDYTQKSHWPQNSTLLARWVGRFFFMRDSHGSPSGVVNVSFVDRWRVHPERWHLTRIKLHEYILVVNMTSFMNLQSVSSKMIKTMTICNTMKLDFLWNLEYIFIFNFFHHRINSWNPFLWYTLSRENRVVRNRYSRLLFTSEDRFHANLRVQEQSTNMTSQCQ